METRDTFSCYLIGTESLLVQCAEILIEGGHEIRGIITSDAAIRGWAEERAIRALDAKADYLPALREEPFDYFFSITNLSIMPSEVLELPRRFAVNFHDGPLPRYGGLYATAWALINRERAHGVTWHVMTADVDRGDILNQRAIEIVDGETSLTLNAKCYEAGIATFRELVADLASGAAEPRAQTLDRDTYCPKFKRPAAACTISWNRAAADIAALVRALDFGGYANPLGMPKIVVGREVFVVTRANPLTESSNAAPGTVLRVEADTLRVATADGDLELSGVATLSGESLSIREFVARTKLSEGGRLAELDPALAERVTTVNAAASRGEEFWVGRLASREAVEIPYARQQTAGSAGDATYAGSVMRLPESATVGASGHGPARDLAAAFAAYLARVTGATRFDIGYRDPALLDAIAGVEPWFAEHVPLRVDLDGTVTAGEAIARIDRELEVVRKRGTHARDVAARYPELRSAAGQAFAVVVGHVAELDGRAEASGGVLTVLVSEREGTCRWIYRTDVLAAEDVERMQRQFAVFLDELAGGDDRPLMELSLLGDPERRTLLTDWNATERAFPSDACIHELIEAQAERTPDAAALAFRDEELTYGELNARANQLAHHLRKLGVGPDVLVGLCVERSIEMMVGLLAVHKAGGAYVPLDPAYPRDRLALMLEDSQVPVLLTQSRLDGALPEFAGSLVRLDADWPVIAAESRENLAGGAAPDNLAYVIYTSGSTGKPKGVLVEHRNVVNFFTGMDERIGADEPGVWLAVTSLSFDISVLELLWTLARGYEVVIFSDEDRKRAAESGAGEWAHKAIDFSLFYFSSDESEGVDDKYRLLLEGARFGDGHGFSAVWTPERHFHAFGGLYPNPAVTSAAIAAITERIQIRAGSVVLPLHHPIRVAEEWSVVDNISKGRVGISFAAGWQPNDFVLRPENYREAKQVMLREIETVRKLWRGESIRLQSPAGKEVELRILPRPVQAELPYWLTTAGNPETFEMAGRSGARVLTHLLGQSVDELADKLALYRKAWREAGHPGEGFVSLMLHTFVGEDRDAVREVVRGPLTEYLRSSISLIKQYAWSFPAFKKRIDGNGANGGLDFESLTEEEMEALLAYSFERYYETSGLFGRPEDCLAMVDRLKGIGVDDIACLIDFGIHSDTVLEHLPQLDRLRQLANAHAGSAPAAAPGDDSVAGLIERHGVTHMQCTPSMAGMLLMDDRTREALRSIRTLLIGGEAFPVSLAGELRELASGAVHNMYGPTETTIWSTTHRLDGSESDAVPIGRPIANTELYIVDPHGRPVPIGVAGELLIGGAGVVRGYLRCPELTAERFIPNPFADGDARRVYRTGDLARYRPDGTVEFLGRIDHQVKIRGYRIELGEIEAALARRDGVREAVVVAREDEPGDKRLVAYVVPRPNAPVAAAGLRDALRVELPEFMVPSHVVVLQDLPRTPNAKIDRNALPSPDQIETVPAADFVKPAGELEQAIAAIWQDVLKLPKVGVQDNFFDLGGHSLLAVQVHSRLCKTLDGELSITDLFRFPTINSLAAFLGQETASGSQAGVSRAEARRQSMARRRQLRQSI